MAGKYTDKECTTFSKIAYQDLNSGYQMAVRSGNYPDGKVPLKDLPPADVARLKNECGLTDSQINTWKIADVHDTNGKNGFYGCIIDTGDGRAAVAFRGSEDMMNGNNAQTDWADADFALLSQTQTRQHAEVDRWLSSEKAQSALNEYDSITMTGHSLGGNLAEYATITSNEHGLDGKINQCVNLDGPGFNKEFLNQHQAQIDNMSSVMTHYRWSLVGNCLTDPSGTDINARVTDDGVNHPLTRHDMKYLDFDSNGNIKVNDRLIDPFSGRVMNDFTTWLDRFPAPVKDGIVFTTNLLFRTGIGVIKGVKKTINKVKDWFGGLFGGNKGKSGGGGGGGGHGGGHSGGGRHSGGGGSSGGGGASRGAGGGRADRLLVPFDTMRATIARYKKARESLAEATKRMDSAWEQLNRVWDGSIKATFMGQWVVLMGNIEKSEGAVTRSLDGLERTATLFANTESANTSTAQSLNSGTVPPLF